MLLNLVLISEDDTDPTITGLSQWNLLRHSMFCIKRSLSEFGVALKLFLRFR